MTHSAFIWLLLNLISIFFLAFYSMLEMACVSFNKVRLQYYVSKGIKRAEWLNWLLQNPTRLFGTTLIGVNIATVVGSEFAREFHSAIGINPDFSPISQVFLVVIFGELAPMFAARRYAEHVVMLGVPFIYASAKLMTPLIWAFGGITRIFNFLSGEREASSNLFLTQEELEKILEEQEEDKPSETNTDFNAVSGNIFNMRLKSARQVMEPLNSIPTAPSNASVAQVIDLLRKSESDYATIYHRDPTNIISIIQVRDLLRASPSKRARDYGRPPWFVTQSSSVMQILNQFRNNNHELAIILDPQGGAEGLIHMDDIVEEIFGQTNYSFDQKSPARITKRFFIERSFPGDTPIGVFNRQFRVVLDKREELTLTELMVEQLGHPPEMGESIEVPPFELTVVEASLMEVKSIKVKG
ncbi:MAG: hemolysin family protein [Parachlamydia sp.]|nr:hemolysin family protein [Parachlamydia sp.]